MLSCQERVEEAGASSTSSRETPRFVHISALSMESIRGKVGLASFDFQPHRWDPSWGLS